VGSSLIAESTVIVERRFMRRRDIFFGIFFSGCATEESVGYLRARAERDSAMVFPQMDVGANTDVATTMDAGADSISSDSSNVEGGACVAGESSESIRAAIFVPFCGDCHSGSMPEAGLNLVTPGFDARLIAATSSTCAPARLLVPGDPAGSLLIRKVRRTQGTCGDSMPQGGPALSATDLGRLESWVRSLAMPCRTDGGIPDVANDVLRVDAAMDAPIIEAAVDVSIPRDVTPSTCLSGTTLCGSVCVNLATSNESCGACGRACGVGSTCTAGTCVCAIGLLQCGSSCVNSNDPRNCGSCGVTCATGQQCSRGRCRIGCSGGENTDCSNACVPLDSDALHCGACSRACAAGQTCSAGVCSCPVGQTLCGAACTDTSRDNAHCGSCTTACAVGGRCAASRCEGGTVSVPDAGVTTDVTIVPDVIATAPRLSANVQPLFDTHCVRCHGASGPSAMLSLVRGSSYTELVGVSASCGGRSLVQASSPGTSYLIDKLMGTSLCGGARMPRGGPYLSAAEIDVIRQWIATGARND
jgi:mono/diheme cytochrome c family protein